MTLVNEKYGLNVHAVHREDVSLVYGDEELNFLLNEFAHRGIKDTVLQEHIYGDVIKFYSVRDTNFFRWYYVNGNNHYKFDQLRLQELAEKSAQVLNLFIYGGDAIISEDGSITLIDVNDWPSFANFRDEASRFIAKIIYEKAVEYSENKKFEEEKNNKTKLNTNEIKKASDVLGLPKYDDETIITEKSEFLENLALIEITPIENPIDYNINKVDFTDSENSSKEEVLFTIEIVKTPQKNKIRHALNTVEDFVQRINLGEKYRNLKLAKENLMLAILE